MSAVNARTMQEFNQRNVFSSEIVGVVQYLHELCNKNALEWVYSIQSDTLDITLNAGRGSVFTVRLFESHEYADVVQKFCAVLHFDTISAMKLYIEDRLSRLERYDITPGKERSIWDTMFRLTSLIELQF